jgi:hypothetical protein
MLSGSTALSFFSRRLCRRGHGASCWGRRVHLLILLAFVSALPPLRAQSRASATYRLATESVDAGGAVLTSADYQAVTGVAGLVGISAAADAPAHTVKHGYAGQLYDFTGLQLAAAGSTVSESGTVQLSAALLADDASVVPLAPAAVSWSVLSGPLVSVSANGLASAGTVFQSTGATVGGAAGGFAASLLLTVLDVGTDDFGLYAGDGLPDAWQVQYFGVGNPLASPAAQPLHDGQSNLLKFLTGYAPVGGAGGRFEAVGSVAGEGFFQLQLSQVIPGTRYRFQRSTDLQTWTTLQTVEPVALAQPFTQLLPTTGTSSFFRVIVEKAAP